MKKKVMILSLSLLATSLLLVGLAGCGSSKNNKANTNSNTLLGKVTKVDGNKITLALATQNLPPDKNSAPGTNKDTDQQGTPSEKTADNPNAQTTNNNSGNSSSDKNGGNQPPSDGQSSNGGMPPAGGKAGNPPSRGMGPGANAITLTGETKIITISDSTTITRQSRDENTSAKVSDIQAGAIVRITLDGETVTSITIQQSHNDDRNNNTGKNTDNSENTDNGNNSSNNT